MNTRILILIATALLMAPAVLADEQPNGYEEGDGPASGDSDALPPGDPPCPFLIIEQPGEIPPIDFSESCFWAWVDYITTTP